MRRTVVFSLILALLIGNGFVPGSQDVHAQGESTTDIPIALVTSGATSYTLAAPKVFWYTTVPPCPPTAAPESHAPVVQYPETIKRVATYGSPIRTLYDELRDCGDWQVLSNIVADADYLYWLGPVGLMRLSTEANPGDPPEIINALVDAPGELAIASDRIYAIHNNTGGSNTEVSYVWKDNHQKVHLAYPGSYAGDLQTDGEFVYYLVGGNLIRLEPGVNSGEILTNGVSGYYPEGSRLLVCTINPFECFFSNNVYVGKGRYIYVYNNNNDTLGSSPIYTSVDSTAAVYDLVTDFSHLFFFERRTIPCSPQPCFPSSTYVVNRTLRGGGTADVLYTYGPTLFTGLQNLRTDGSFLFWGENGLVQRLPNDAAALPQVNLYVTGMEVTQAVQNLTNSVRLIKNKRTFVRVYVRSEGVSVAGVGAQLSAPALSAVPLQPVNPVGTKITVRTNPNRTDLNQSFLFELPWSWTQENSLNLQFTLNPYKVPLEPNYDDNGSNLTVNFQNSPTLSVEFFRLNYTLNNTTYRPRISEDVLRTYSWILRAYPIGGAVGDKFKPRLWDVEGGTQLGSWVDTSNPLCSLIYNDPDDDIALCASYFTNGWLFYYRVATMFGVLNVGLNPNAFYYGMISDASNNFPRGQAIYDRTSVGPAGIPGQFFGLGSGWDTDGTFADWYAAHEIGHSLGRAHPNAGSDNPSTDNVQENCGHSRSDPGYPYGNTSSSAAPIGPADGSMEGFDVGDPGFGISKAVLPSSTWNDVMSYCNNQWISDYTYNAMYDYMIAHPSLPTGLEKTAVSGDFLAVAGAIHPNTEAASFSFVRRLDNVVEIPALTPGDYALRLVDAGNNVLASYAFTPQLEPETGILGFSQVIDFVAGTRSLQIVNTANNQLLSTMAVSANAPVISNVALQGAPDPVDGVVTLGWNASDPDGGTLTFDIAYSRDNGATFQPVKINVSGSSTQIDTASLGGSGTAILRVTASDGVNCAYADSPGFVMANKAPTPFITSPADSTQVHYGQLVNFSGLALDAQDSLVAESGLAWFDGDGNLLGNGSLLSIEDLPVGTNTITLEATNSQGLSATASITVIVDDDLSLPGPSLSVGPGQVSWHVEAGSTTLLTAEISINNAGGGELNWTASEDAAWLSLSAASGTVAADGDASMLTLTADPTGIASGTTASAYLTLTKPASGSSPEQTIDFPVALSVGNVWSAPPIAPFNNKLYLPMLSR